MHIAHSCEVCKYIIEAKQTCDAHKCILVKYIHVKCILVKCILVKCVDIKLKQKRPGDARESA